MKRGLAALLLCAALGACTKVTTTSTTAARSSVSEQPPINTGTGESNGWTRPHVLRMTLGAEDIENLNPALTSDTSVSLITGPLTMGYLVRFDPQNRPVPELITQIPDKANGGVSADGRTITYHVRQGVKWSDGAPFTADDVVFSFRVVLNPQNNVTGRAGFDRITKIDEPDKYTVVLHLSKPYSPFFETFFSTSGAQPAVLPKHLLAQYPNINNVSYNSAPVGIAPFKVQQWQRGQRVVMVANPYYWRGMPKLKEIDYEIIPNINTMLTEMQSKTLDLSYQTPPSVYPQTKNLADFYNWAQPSYYFRHLDFNLASPKLSDPIVRQALRLATDRSTILAKLYHGIGVLQEQPAPKVSVYWDPNIRQAPFDLQQANRMLDQDGWMKGRDGVRAKNGVRLDLNFVTATGTVINDQLIEQLRQTWKQIGVNITVTHYLNTLLFAQYQDGGILYRGKFDVAYFSWGLDAISDLSTIYSCEQRPPNGQNILNWCNRTANDAMAAFYSHYDQPQRNADDAVVMEQLDKDVPTIVTMGTSNLWVYNTDLKNFNPGSVSPFDNFMNVDI